MKKVLFFWVTVFICVQTNAQEKRPNIILFLVDDMGWQDTSVPFWKEKTEFNKLYIEKLDVFVRAEYGLYPCYPPFNQIFNAFDSCEFEAVKVVIIGQDPYHGKNQAHGLSFSVPDGVNPPPSLENMFKELKKNYSGRYVILPRSCTLISV